MVKDNYYQAVKFARRQGRNFLPSAFNFANANRFSDRISSQFLFKGPEGKTLTEVETEEDSYPKKTMGKTYYTGKFKKAKTVGKSGKELYLETGSGCQYETTGVKAAADTVWVGLSNYPITAVCNQVAIAFLRTLFKKAGIVTQDAREKLRLTNAAFGVESSYDCFLEIVQSGTDGSTATGTYAITANETLYSLGLYLSGFFENYVKGQIVTYPLSLTLRRFVTVGANNARDFIMASLNMKAYVVDILMTNKVAVQNRTRGADEANDVTDVVDNQPLKGKVYYFAKGNPLVNSVGDPLAVTPKMVSIFELWNDTGNGLKMIGNEDAGYDAQLNHLPQKNYFLNCTKVSNIYLNPGEIKTYFIKDEIHKFYLNWLKGMVSISAFSRRSQWYADTVLLGFEEMINTGSANKITIAAESDYGCYTRVRNVGKFPLVAQFNAGTI